MAVYLKIISTGARTYAERNATLAEWAASGAILEPVTPVTNGTTQTEDKGTYYPCKIDGPTEIEAGKNAIYTVSDYKLYRGKEESEEALKQDKIKVKWTLYVDDVKILDGNINHIKFFTKKVQKSESSKDFMEIEDVKERTKKIKENGILYYKIDSNEDDAKKNTTKLTVKFSKWLDGHKVHIEAYRNNPDLKPEKDHVVSTEIKAKPEIVDAYWTNDKREKITNKTIGYKDTVYLFVKALGMKDKQVTTALWEEGVSFMGSYQGNDEELCMNENIEWKLDGRDNYKKLELPGKDDEEYKKQREGIWETDPLELYFALPSEKQTKGYEEKYGRLLYLSTKEILSEAYFAKEIKQEGIKDGTVKEEKEKPKFHVVQKNETLSIIAPKYGIHWEKDLAKANKMKSPWSVAIGDKLKLPDNAVISTDTNTEEPESKPNAKEETVYERIETASLGSEVWVVVETANLKGKKVTIEVFDDEELFNEDSDKPITLLNGESEVTKLENITIDDTGKAKIKIKLRPKSDDDFKKLKKKFKKDKASKLFLKVTCKGEDKNHEKKFLDGEEFEVTLIASNTTFDKKYTANEDEIYINVITPKKRHLQGPLVVFDHLGQILFKTHSLCRGSNDDRFKGGGNGDTPTGRATTSYSPKRHNGNYSFGNHGLIYLTGESGEFLKATNKGRSGIAIHCGHNVGYYKKSLEDKGQLMSTYGCIRVYNDEMEKLGKLYTKLKNKGKTIYCYIEDYDGDIKDVYNHYNMKIDTKDTAQTERSTKQ